MTKRTRIVIGIGSFVALYTVAWFVLANIAERMIVQQMEEQRANGITIAMGERHCSGYPFALSVTAQDFSVTDASSLSLTAPKFVMSIGLLAPSHLRIAAPDNATLTIPASKTRGQLKLAAEVLTGTVDLTTGTISGATMTFSGTTIEGVVAEETPLAAASLTLHADWPEMPPADHTGAGMHVALTAGAVIVPGEQIPGLGNNIKNFSIDATLMDKIPTLDEAGLKAWSNDGGTVEIHTLATDWGPLGLTMDGTLALDPALQPMASFNARITGFAETLNALATTRTVKPSTAAMASIGLGLLAQPNGPDNVPTVTVPLTLQNGAVYLSSFKLAKLPPVKLY